MNGLTRQTDRIVIVHFPAFSGGKFLMNCLSLSRHCVPQNTTAARYLIDHPDDYDYRLHSVCSTLPTPLDMQNWREKWEFGDTEFYQGAVSEHLEAWYENRPTPIDDFLQSLIQNNLCFFMTSHGGWSNVKAIVKAWPHARIILLINSARFWSLAVKLKQRPTLTQSHCFRDYAGNECWESYDLLRGPDWPDWIFFEKNSYDIDKVSKYVTITLEIRREIKKYYEWHENTNNLFCFDVDNNYFSRKSFLTTMKQLYDWAGFRDYNPILIDQYYSKYISLHKDMHEQTF